MIMLVITNRKDYIVITLIIIMKSKFHNTQQRIILTDVLRKKPMSIAQLLRETGMKRATCIYYLNQLEVDGLIKKKRIEEGETGRPTIIEFQEKVYQQRRNSFYNV